MSSHNLVEQALEDIKAGKFVLVVDDQDRENEGDLILAADKVTPAHLAFMIRHTSGIVCLALTPERLDQLRLPLMVSENTESFRTAFTVSVDYRHGTTTGVSAADRAATIRALVDPNTQPEDFCRPGHIFPLKYRTGGVLKRAGHTEAAVDLAQMAGLSPAGVLCEVAKDDGTMSRLPDLEIFAKEHGLTLISVADIIKYRRKKEKLVRCISNARMPTQYGEFNAIVYESVLDGMQHIAIVKGEVAGKTDVLVRVHSECLTGDVFNSRRCDCGAQLEKALKMIAEDKCGAVIYLRGHEGRGIGIGHKLRAYQLQDQGRDTVEANLELGFSADSREYGIGAQILADLGITTIRLMTNNPIKYGGLGGYDLKIVERIPLVIEPNEENQKYLQTKRTKLGHYL